MQTQINQQGWTQLNELVRQKSVDVDEKVVRILELQPGFQETQWCYKGHIGYVIAGGIEVEFESDTQIFNEGDVVVLQTAVGHKAKAIGKTTLFLVDG